MHHDEQEKGLMLLFVALLVSAVIWQVLGN
jgi:hypothetical protein